MIDKIRTEKVYVPNKARGKQNKYSLKPNSNDIDF